MSARLDMGDAGPGGGDGSDGAVRLFRVAAADDLRLLAALHDRELDSARLMALWQECYEDFLGLRLVGEPGRRALALLREGLTDIPASLGAESLDRLAADYADIYLTHGLRASPYESVWLDEESLVMQAPMFDVRAWYGRHGLVVPDWRERNDDHLVHQLQFLAHLLAPDEGEGADLAEVARFLDDHLLLWIDRFAERVARALPDPILCRAGPAHRGLVGRVARDSGGSGTGSAPNRRGDRGAPTAASGDVRCGPTAERLCSGFGPRLVARPWMHRGRLASGWTWTPARCWSRRSLPTAVFTPT